MKPDPALDDRERDLLFELGELLVKFAGRGMPPLDAATLMFGAASGWLAQYGTTEAEMTGVVKSAVARHGVARDGGPREDETPFTIRVQALVDLWRARALARVQFEATILSAARERAPELLAELDGHLGPNRGSA